MEHISLQEFGLFGIAAVAVVALFKVYTATVAKSEAKYEKQIDELRAECKEWKDRAWASQSELVRAREIVAQLTEVAKGAVEIEARKAAQK